MKYRVAEIAVASIWLALLLFSIVLQAYGRPGWAEWSVLIVLGCAGTLVVSRFHNVMSSFMGVFILLEFGIRPIVVYFIPSLDGQLFTFYSVWSQTLSYQFQGYALFMAAFSLASMGDSPKGVGSESVPGLGFLTSLLVVIWLARVLVLHGVADSIIGRISSFSPFVVAATTLLITRPRENSRPRTDLRVFAFSALLAVTEVGWAFLSKTKLPVLLDVEVVLLTLSTQSRVRVRFVTLLMIAVASILFIGAVQIYRDPLIYSGQSWATAGLQNLVSRSNNFDTDVRVMALTPYVVPYWGKEMVLALLQTLALPFPFPGKINLPVGNIVASLYYGYSNPNVYLALGIPMSFFLVAGRNLGLALSTVFGALSGALFGHLRKGTSWWRYSFLVAFVVSFSDIEQSFFDVVDHFEKDALLCCAAYLVHKISQGVVRR